MNERNDALALYGIEKFRTAGETKSTLAKYRGFILSDFKESLTMACAYAHWLTNKMQKIANKWRIKLIIYML